MASYHAPKDWEDRIDWLAAALHGRSRWRLPLLLFGALFASGRRVVASWIRAAGVSDDYQDYYAFLQSVGRQWSRLGGGATAGARVVASLEGPAARAAGDR